jgi:hypothetical protein
MQSVEIKMFFQVTDWQDCTSLVNLIRKSEVNPYWNTNTVIKREIHIRTLLFMSCMLINRCIPFSDGYYTDENDKLNWWVGRLNCCRLLPAQ